MNYKGNLKFIKSRKLMHELVEKSIKKQADHCETLNILEAGCGNHWPYNLEGIEYILTGVDLDKDALAARKNISSDLHIAINGDLCLVDLGVEQYDVIYSAYVLEHIERADVVIKNFVKWIKPGGIIIILIPDPYSVQGFITRFTPHWFHVIYYRFLLGNKNAGKPGHGPYPTYYHPIVSRSGIRDFCNNESNGVVLAGEYADEFIRPGSGAVAILLHAFKRVMNIVSLGTLSARHTNLIYFMHKKKV